VIIIIGAVTIVVVVILVEYFLPSKIDRNIKDYEKDNKSAERRYENEQHIRDRMRSR